MKHIDSYLVALKKEIALQANYLQGEKIQTLYWGGGTPSLLSSSQIESLMSELQKYFSFSPDLEWTIEINPEQASSDYLSELKKMKINRLSIGIQSLNDTILRSLNRKHCSKEALHAIENALKVGFDNLSIDLIYGILERKKDQWAAELNTVLTYPISHLSAYALTVEENSMLSKKCSKASLPDMEARAAEDLEILWQISENYGFEQYEISNFARNACISKHNFAYWNEIPYLGLGPSAHSYNRKSRQWNTSNLSQYIDSLNNNTLIFEKENLTEKEIMNEYILLKLRTWQGIDISDFQDRFGKERTQKWINGISKIDANYFIFHNHNYKLSRQGILLADEIAMKLFEI